MVFEMLNRLAPIDRVGPVAFDGNKATMITDLTDDRDLASHILSASAHFLNRFSSSTRLANLAFRDGFNA